MAKVTIFVFFFFSLSEFTVRANEFAKADKTFENSLFAKLAGSVTANRKHLTFDPDISRTPIAIQELLRYKGKSTLLINYLFKKTIKGFLFTYHPLSLNARD